MRVVTSPSETMIIRLTGLHQKPFRQTVQSFRQKVRSAHPANRSPASAAVFCLHPCGTIRMSVSDIGFGSPPGACRTEVNAKFRHVGGSFRRCRKLVCQGKKCRRMPGYILPMMPQPMRPPAPPMGWAM